MNPIQMVDLKSQYKHIKQAVDKSIIDVIESAAFIKGPEVKELECELAGYLNVKQVMSCANGTDALQIALMALDLKPGDEVITTNFTFLATAEVIALLQLTPVLVDCLPDTFNIDPVAVENSITDKTKAIIPVHLFGQCADMESIMNIANKHNLFVIEDTAQAIGAEYTFNSGETKKAGTIGHIGTTSFFPSKNLGCYGDGGAIFTNDKDLALKIAKIANHGMEKRYYHDLIGVNSRLDSVQAAVLRIKLPLLNTYNANRFKAASFYSNAFKDNDRITTPFLDSKSSHVFHQYTLQIENVDQFAMQSYLNEQGIPAMIYYPVPLHLQDAYKNDRYNEGDFPVTEKLCKTVLSLPMHTELQDDQLEHITSHVLKYLTNN